MGRNVILLCVVLCRVFMCSCFVGNRTPSTSTQINTSQTREGKKKYLDLFVWDSTIAMSEEGGMETAMMLLPVHRTTHLTFSKGVCHFSQ